MRSRTTGKDTEACVICGEGNRARRSQFNIPNSSHSGTGVQREALQRDSEVALRGLAVLTEDPPTVSVVVRQDLQFHPHLIFPLRR